MKQVIILIVAILLLIFAGIYEISYLKNSSKYLLSDINYSKQYINEENFYLAKEHYNALKETWENLRDPWGIFIDHDEVGEMDEALLAYKSYLDKEQEIDAYVEICEIERIVNHIVEKQEVKIGNVF